MTPKSRSQLLTSSKKYESIEVYHEDVINQDDEFLKPIFIFLDSLKSLTFKGAYTDSCIDCFFNELKRDDVRKRFHVENLTFMGDIRNTELILSKFYDIKKFTTVTFFGMKSEKFCNILAKTQNTKNIVLKDMDIREIDRTFFTLQGHIEKIVLSMTKISRGALKDLMNHIPSLREIKTNNLSSLDVDTKDLFTRIDDDQDYRIEISPTLPSRDFFIGLPEHLHNFVLLHFNVEDLLNVSQVSTTCYKFTREAIRKKVLFNSLHEADHEPRNNYENIEIAINDTNSLSRFASFRALKEVNLEVETDLSGVYWIFAEQLSSHNLTIISITCHKKLQLDDLKLPATVEILYLSNFKMEATDPTTTSFYTSLVKAKALENLEFNKVTGLEKMFVSDLSKGFTAQLKRFILP